MAISPSRTPAPANGRAKNLSTPDILAAMMDSDSEDELTIVRAREQLIARPPTKSDWAEEDRRARSPPAKAQRGGLPFFSPRKNPDGSEHVAAKRMSRKDVRDAEGAEARQKERAAALKVTKPSASSTSNQSPDVRRASDVEAASRAGVRAGSSTAAKRLLGLLWSTLVFVALVFGAFVVCVALDQRGLFPDVMTPRSMRAFADRATAAMTAIDLRASVDAYMTGARAFGAKMALSCVHLERRVATSARAFGAACVAEGDTVARAVRAVLARATSAFER
mmetsp:Transcript_1775/g.6916  ORF Transcript_1775/g.6916 Transcript_1775/m.6916 type:complete len:279 (+) Transcript_1775:188-1024(+)